MKVDVEKILSGNIRALSKAITLTESKKLEHQQISQDLIDSLLPHTGNSMRIGISGTPGAGKSTLIESLGLKFVKRGKKVAVLAIDPSSPISGGSILGDKTRMEKLSQEKNAYIRPTPNSGTLGGVAQKTREAMLLCEAAGFDVILVETVGVGQSEYEVSNMVDFFTVVLLPGGGDELQGIKKGIIEISNCILINKADGDNLNKAKTTQREYLSALHILNSDSKWSTKVETISALNQEGVDNFISIIQKYFDLMKADNSLDIKRLNQNNNWLKKIFFEMLENKITNDKTLQEVWKQSEDKIRKDTATPLSAANQMIKLIFDK